MVFFKIWHDFQKFLKVRIMKSKIEKLNKKSVLDKARALQKSKSEKLENIICAFIGIVLGLAVPFLWVSIATLNVYGIIGNTLGLTAGVGLRIIYGLLRKTESLFFNLFNGVLNNDVLFNR